MEYTDDPSTYITHKGIRYYHNHLDAAGLAFRIRSEYPGVRIVRYERGWAVQCKRSGAYYPELETD